MEKEKIKEIFNQSRHLTADLRIMAEAMKKEVVLKKESGSKRDYISTLTLVGVLEEMAEKREKQERMRNNPVIEVGAQ
jgi:hypothetical protein